MHEASQATREIEGGDVSPHRSLPLAFREELQRVLHEHVDGTVELVSVVTTELELGVGCRENAGPRVFGPDPDRVPEGDVQLLDGIFQFLDGGRELPPQAHGRVRDGKANEIVEVVEVPVEEAARHPRGPRDIEYPGP